MSISEFIFQFINSEIPLEEFEVWVYQTSELEEILGPDAYLDLIDFNFRSKDALHQVKQKLLARIGIEQFETWYIHKELTDLINDVQDPVDIIGGFYAMYCNGYRFLGPIGLMYVEGIDDMPRLLERELWDEVAFAQKRTTLQPYLDRLKPVAQRLLEAIDNKQIRITGEYCYEIEPDLESELKQKYFMPVVQVAQG